MTEIENPSFYSILPADVRYDKTLTSTEKLLFSEITSLCNKNGSCWANNEYFANLFHKHADTISRNISNLAKKKKIFVFYKRRGAQIKERVISLIPIEVNLDFTDDKNVNGSDDKNVNGSNDKNVKENNTSINNKNKNIINNIFTKSENLNDSIKKTYGEFNNVFLTDTEYVKLQNRFPKNYLDKINNLSEYLESIGKDKYASHYAVILNWSRRKKQKSNFQKSIEEIDSY